MSPGVRHGSLGILLVPLRPRAVSPGASRRLRVVRAAGRVVLAIAAGLFA
jgi:hypothetical protein